MRSHCHLVIMVCGDCLDLCAKLRKLQFVTVENGAQLVGFMSASGGSPAAPSTICLSIIGHDRSIFDA
jgi:hypothetical protein